MNKSSKASRWNRTVSFLSGEFMLGGKANGGSIIFARAIFVALLTYVSAVLVKEICTPEKMWSTSLPAVGRAISETLPWFGAIFAGVYAALYARFSSQWNYIAGLYNQIKAAEVQLAIADNGERAAEVMAQWKAGFIEDADALHLSSKPMIAGIIKAWLPDPLVQKQIAKHTPEGDALVTRLCALNGIAQANLPPSTSSGKLSSRAS